MANVYLDTNVLIYLLEGHPVFGKQIAVKLEDFATDGNQFITSAITITEFLAGTTSSQLGTLQQVPRLSFVTLDEVLAENAANLQRKHPGLQIGDAIHLATALQQASAYFYTNDRYLARIVSGYVSTITMTDK